MLNQEENLRRRFLGEALPFARKFQDMLSEEKEPCLSDLTDRVKEMLIVPLPLEMTEGIINPTLAEAINTVESYLDHKAE